MTNLEARPAPELCAAHADAGAVAELYEPREVPLGGLRAMEVRRTLPQRALPMVGAWCFLDEFGPQHVDMRVLPHPHTGLQTVTWPVAGEIRHRDSLGSDVVVRPGQLNLMTAGRGVSHSEFSLGSAPLLHAVQLWVALPDGAAGGPAAFEQVTFLPTWESRGARATVFIGELDGARSPAGVHTPLLGAEVVVEPRGRVEVPLDQAFEHAVLVLSGTARVAGTDVAPGPLLYLGEGRASVPVESHDGATLLLLGGARFEHDLVMWWNFVGRTHADIADARAAWASDTSSDRFGTVAGHDGVRIPAPDLPNVRLQPRRRAPQA
ncbi:pirin family protein [Cellulomonas rhizosphaerae]|uniref:Pirin family protein n=1 Tax=Cellulomonas rhizosphaerae TaxID=2293719 RepID=A0A413RNA3_9CELL|nr:pirin family protein [Cellulomonas rhizosphaerae]RHA43492.1 pirin family protein [Cellulomonas rhizosphaerae]